MIEYKIFCDLDGVLSDFSKAYLNLTGIDLKGKYVDLPDFWKSIDKAGEKFWSEMEWKKDGKELWNHIKQFDPIILSAPSDNITSITGKFKWITKNIPGTKLILRKKEKKHEFAKDKFCILIDDMEETIKRWNNAGGTGIHHISTKETIKRLEDILN